MQGFSRRLVLEVIAVGTIAGIATGGAETIPPRPTKLRVRFVNNEGVPFAGRQLAGLQWVVEAQGGAVHFVEAHRSPGLLVLEQRGTQDKIKFLPDGRVWVDTPEGPPKWVPLRAPADISVVEDD